MSVKVEELQIVLYPDPVLRRKAKPIEEITEETRTLAAKMIALMHEAEGVGLAAPQVGLSLRLFVANPTGQPQDDRVFINPLLRDAGRDVEPFEEGCLSIPAVRGEVRRPKEVSIEATDLQGHTFTLTSDALPARIWQHETDHLDGILILDRMAPVDKRANRRKIKELEDRYEAVK